ncbi:MAG TPA: N-acetylgalactosamine-6-sulfatase [Planctomycetaceae bacterium]|nr:N-acetylgalactosamine-6-sulfatase [Planctomycetaceae bacterium]
MMLWVTLAHHSSNAQAESAPNIIIFLVDDMGIMDTSVPFLETDNGAVGRHPLNDFYQTPNMQRLAATGIRFNQFSAMSVCSPTRISLMTGQNAARHRTTTWINPDQNNAGPQGPPQWNWAGLKPGDVTLASVLKNHGYRTIHIGKAHFAPRDTAGENPATLGFDINIAGASFGAPGSYYAKNHFGAVGKRKHHAVPDLEKYHGTETFLTDALTQEAKSQITASVDKKQPFFLHLAHYAVHAPFESDPRFAANYAQSEKPNPAKAFATLVQGMDHSLGQILDHLDELEIADETFIVFLGDNGSDAPLGHEHAIACAAPLRGKKGSHYEGGTRVPFITTWAKPNPQAECQQQVPIAAGDIQNQPANVCDIFPTVLSVARCDAPKNHPIDGGSLKDLLLGESDQSHDSSFLMHFPHAPHRSDYWTSLRDGDWKVIYHYFPSNASAGKHYQLFHLADDPSESNDLSASHPAELRSMMAGMIAKLNQYNAVYPIDAQTKLPVKPLVP